METLIYLGKVNLCWVLFYVCYRLFLHRHTFFVWNRVYLLSTLVAGLAIPAIHLSEETPIIIKTAAYTANAFPASAVITSIPLPGPATLPWENIMLAMLGAGSMFMIARLLHAFRNLFKVITEGDSIHFDDHTLVLLPHSEIGSFSFFKWLVVNRNDYENNLDFVLRHEATHIRQLHSFDIMLIEILKIACWFNLVLWFYKQSVQEIHEFLADEKAPNRDRYATFLVSYGLNPPLQSLTNHFFNSSLLKRRIVMIYKTRSSNWLLGKYAMIVPVVMIIILGTASSPRKSAIATRITTKIAQPPQPLRVAIAETSATDTKPKPSSENKTETIHIEGVILDESGKPVSKATLLLADKQPLTRTDANGAFTIKGIDVGSRILVSHISFDNQLFVAKKSSRDYKIVLTRNKTMLNEMVIVGYRVTPSKETEKESAQPQPDSSNYVQKMPEFPGGQSEMYKYIGKNIKYPPEAAKNNTQGTVYLTFTVNENGSIRNPRVVKGLGHGTDEEALRVLLGMPRWQPAEQNGEKVSADYNMAVRFTLQN